MNVKKTNKNNRRVVKVVPKDSRLRTGGTGNRIQKRKQNLTRNAVVARAIEKRIDNTKKMVQKVPTPPAFSDYIRTMLFHDQPICTSPLEPRKLFYKKVKYQDTLQVNASGHLFIGGCIRALSAFGNSSTTSPILYANQSGYSPTSTSNALTGGWNLTLVGSSGINIASAEIPRQYIMNAHLSFSLSGVSNLNKQGQIHMFEDLNATARYGAAGDLVYNSALVNEYPIQDLPKCSHYKRLDIMNMDSSTTMEHNYIPLMNDLILGTQTVGAYSVSSTFTGSQNKTFGFIISSAAVGTTVRVEYEILFAQEVNNDYINNYPPEYSRIYVDADPTLQLLQQNTNNILRTEKHDDNAVFELIKDVRKYDREGYTHVDPNTTGGGYGGIY